MIKLGDKVNCKPCTGTGGFNSPAMKGIVTLMGLKNGLNTDQGIYIQVRGTSGSYNFLEKNVSVARTQTLHAYTDSTDEIHWSSRPYSAKEQASFGFVESKEYNKTIDLD